ncbi:muscarinic acetylcholine receptor M5-like [Lytechinus variegatus]|uniref:muscarinic acetylcholine receptor M5-like n=1 Tax=Lytechinus variegatus TaxID=7654 RepID=UPI001BB1D432|nr:muscarinic acetylcholine receptor M5-like [Lytechinus variegatus]
MKVITESMDVKSEGSLNVNTNQSTLLEDDYDSGPILDRIPLIWGYSLVIIITIVGNLLVILAYCRHSQVRAVPTNTLIFSLSISDFLIGVMVLTINLHWVAEDSWMFGEVVCRLWSILDYTVSYMSTMTIMLISLDRFLLMYQKTRYRTVWTRKRVTIITLVCWAFSITVYVCIAFAMTDANLVDFQDECELEIVYLLPFTIGILIFEFGIPLPIIVLLNISVYYQIHQRSQNLRRYKSNLGLPSTDPRNDQSHSQMQGMSHAADHSDLPSVSNVHTDRWVKPLVEVLGSSRNQSRPLPEVNGPSGSGLQTNHNPGTQRIATYRRHKRLFARHKKAALTLSILVGTFLACWLPYEIVSILQAMCGEDDCFSETTWEVVNGLLWGNSALNPILYGLTNPTLRRNMINFGCQQRCRRPRVGPS